VESKKTPPAFNKGRNPLPFWLLFPGRPAIGRRRPPPAA